MPYGRTIKFRRRVWRSWLAAHEFGPVYQDYRVLYSGLRDLSGNFYCGQSARGGFSRYEGLKDAILAMLPGDKLFWHPEDDDLSPENLRAAAYKIAYRNGLQGKVSVLIPTRLKREVVIKRR